MPILFPAKHWKNGRYEMAEKETRKAIELNSLCSMWYQNLGFILESMGRYDEANESFLKSLEVLPAKTWIRLK